MYTVSWIEIISKGTLLGIEVNKSLIEPDERSAKNLVVRLLKRPETSNISIKQNK